MDRRQFAWTLAAASSVWPLAGRAAALTETDAAAGVRAALERGAVAAVGLLGRTDGFLGNPKVRIPLPGALEDAAGLLRATGQGKRVDELVTAMNRAAEAAVPEARTLLVSAAKSISVEDALDIVRGGDTSVTDFFARKTREPLGVKFLPIVTKATEKVKLADRYNAVAGKASRFGLIRQEDANVQQYVTAKALDGLYLMIGEEEKKIRADPVGTGSAILRKVFSL
ncbi:DUF4197 domain-containing protein [Rubrivivax sp. JA1024]|uniref:DUF4197 domain-containing protein n=1 Tax=unclassified Rubrivivax TaxID=2649762 RepID=UPI0013E98C66|nr:MULTISPECIES: DUF4197 domain-containing protein [unclassified Rubrivivax]MCC9648623.1 DUF4197 domain-containing protein [Rubrivivax sp. JA1029]MCD0422443.1 DUF4197 domain-containing protein [Rubrivivax sp. JA1024]